MRQALVLAASVLSNSKDQVISDADTTTLCHLRACVRVCACVRARTMAGRWMTINGEMIQKGNTKMMIHTVRIVVLLYYTIDLSSSLLYCCGLGPKLAFHDKCNEAREFVLMPSHEISIGGCICLPSSSCLCWLPYCVAWLADRLADATHRYRS